MPTKRRTKNFKIRQFLLKNAPDFCWMTAHDLYLMVEQAHEDADYRTVRVVLCALKKSGDFRARIAGRSFFPWRSNGNYKQSRGMPRFVYLRVHKR